MDLKLKVKNTIAVHGLIQPGDTVLLGLSGGPDSLCLLHLLQGLRESLDFELCALHVNHMIRGGEADADEAFIREYTAAAGIDCSVVRVDVPAIAREKHISAEEAGRNVRREAFASWFDRRAVQNGKLALAHNMDDQAETVLMRILRGTGTRGLAGMDYICPLGSAHIIRPLLDASREEIEEYCRINGLTPRIDSTNLKADYTRNKLRLELIPLLEKDCNPNIKETLVRLAANAAEDEEALNFTARQALEDARNSAGPTEKEAGAPGKPLCLSIRTLQQYPSAILKRVICLGFIELGLTEGISAAHLNAAESAVRKNYGGKTIEFPAGYRARISKGILELSRQ